MATRRRRRREPAEEIGQETAFLRLEPTCQRGRASAIRGSTPGARINLISTVTGARGGVVDMMTFPPWHVSPQCIMRACHESVNGVLFHMLNIMPSRGWVIASICVGEIDRRCHGTHASGMRFEASVCSVSVASRNAGRRRETPLGYGRGGGPRNPGCARRPRALEYYAFSVGSLAARETKTA